LDGQRADIAGEKEADVHRCTSALRRDEAALLGHVSTRCVTNAIAILDRGTEDEIAAARAGEIGLKPLAEKIRQRSPSKQPQQTDPASIRDMGKNPERARLTRQKGDSRSQSEVWANAIALIVHAIGREMIPRA
jgi:hypothetical protein